MRPIHGLLLACLLPALFSGCLGNEPSPADASPAEAAADTSLTEPPEDLEIIESIDLSMPDKHEWSWKIAPGYEEAHVRFTLRGVDGAPINSMHNYCWQVKAPSSSSGEGNCATGANINVAIAVMQLASPDRDLLDDSDPEEGRWTVSLDHGPAAAVLEVEYVARYA